MQESCQLPPRTSDDDPDHESRYREDLPEVRLLIYVLLGQTASGKTSLALELAREFSLPVVSADAYQCYRMMNIGTDKPSRKEVEGIPYYFYDEYEPDEDVSVFTFQSRMRPIL
ncbi:MAG: isopentenyl transferase family protein, partial [Bacilli bacterium]